MRLVSLSISAVLALSVAGCSGSGAPTPPSNPKDPHLAGVTARYPVHGAAWNAYVKGRTIADATDTACSAATDAACLHAGETRTVVVTGKATCAGLTAVDALGAFDWSCDASTGTARFTSTGLKETMGLSDLIDFSIPGWKANSVSVYDGASLYATSPSAPWWSNPVVVANAGGTLAGAGTIYVVTDDALAQGYTVGASSIGVVGKPGTIINGPAAGSTSHVIHADGSLGGARDFLWLEGAIDATGDDAGVYLKNVRYSVLRNLQASGADAASGADRCGVCLMSSNENKLSRITASGNLLYGLRLSSALHNTVSQVTATGNQYGLYLQSSSYNRVQAITATGNWAAVELDTATHNTLDGVTAIDNVNGIYMSSSTSNVLSSVMSANNSSYGIVLWSLCNNNVLSRIVTTGSNVGLYVYLAYNNAITAVTATNNVNGVWLRTSSGKNTLSGIAAANNDYGLRIDDSSSSNVVSDVAATHNGYGVYLSVASNNRFAGLLEVGNNTTADCYVGSGTNPGLVNGTCANNGSSNATLSTGASLAASFVGKVTTDDPVNPSDTGGAADVASITEWGAFANGFRSWGKDGSTFPNADNRGRCTTGTCRIWDWSVASSDAVVRDALNPVPGGDDAQTHAWYDATTTTFLRHAVELLGDGVGDDDALCEASETCLHTPDIGAYQGHSSLGSAGTFVDGTITGVTLLSYEANGY